MILELHVNGYPFKELKLPRIKSNPRMSRKENTECRKEKVQAYVKFMEAKYFRQIDKSKSWQIFLKVKSKMK